MSDDDTRQQVGELLKALRVWRGMTPGQLAANAGVDVKTVRSLENGRRWPQDLTRSKLEHVLGVQNGMIAELLEDQTTREKLRDLIRSSPPQHQSNIRWIDPTDTSDSPLSPDPGQPTDGDPTASDHAVIENSWKVATDLAEAVLASDADELLRERTRAAVHTIAAFLIIRILSSGDPAKLEKWLERLYVEREQLYHQLSLGDPTRPWVTEMIGREAETAREVVEESRHLRATRSTLSRYQKGRGEQDEPDEGPQ